MHEAYEATSVIDRLPHTIESIAAYGDRVIIGTKNGFALVYKLESKGGSAFDVSLEQANKAFSKKAVTQLEAIPELDILISLSDNTVTVHELGSLKQLSNATLSLNQTRGANVFAIDAQVLTNIQGAKQCTLKLCVAVRKKLHMYYWKNSSQLFHEIKSQAELSLPDIPKVMCWCKDSICVGFKRDYYMYEVDRQQVNEVFQTGRNLDPLMARVGDDKLALNRDNISVLVDHRRQPKLNSGINWSETPVAMVYRAPYLIGVLPKYVEVRTIEPKHMIQTLTLDKPRILTTTRDGSLYIGSSTGVWRLAYVPVSMQVDQLIQSKEFELALLLSETDSGMQSSEESSRRVHHIKNLHAFELFSQKRYKDSIKIFSDLKTDPSHVIGLYPDLLPQPFRDSIKYPRAPPHLSGADKEQALASLIDYLTLKRTELLKQDKSVKQVDITPLMTVASGVQNAMVKTRSQLAQIIDTTLLKCYLQVNDALVAPLLRLKDNNCHVDESEKVLREHDKLDELIMLYETKQLHKKALKMLLEQSQKPGAPGALRGVERTVDYLQKLGSKHIDTILEYTAWVIKSDPEMGLSIFTDELLDKKQRLPVDRVVKFLEGQTNGANLVISYLRHVIYEWGEINPEYHDKLVICYKKEITPLLDAYISSLPEGQMPARAGTEEDKLGLYRKQLLDFLSSSRYYRAERLIKAFPYESDYHEERAILLGRCGHHKQALFIYVYLLQRQDMAEEYCRQYYDRNIPGRCDVYVHLLGYYLRPLNPADAKKLYGSHYVNEGKINKQSAMELLQQHFSKLNSRKVLELLPDDFSLQDIQPYLEKIISAGESQKRHNTVLRNLLASEKLVMERSRIVAERSKFTVTDKTLCYVCHNKISTSSFARQPSGSLAHLSCLHRDS